MAMTPYSGDLEVIGKLGTTPQERGLTTQQFKDKFDEGLKTFVEEYFNTVHLGEIDAHLADSVTDVDGVHGLKIESGAWTPTLIGTNGGQAVNNAATNGSYIKIGPLVHVQFYLETTSKGDIVPGPIKIGGLPFIISGLVGGDAATPLIAQFNGVTFPSGANWVFGAAVRNQNTIELRFGRTGAAAITISDSDISTAVGIRGSMVYRTL